MLYGVGTVSDHLLSLASAGGRGLPLDVPGLMASILQVRRGGEECGGLELQAWKQK